MGEGGTPSHATPAPQLLLSRAGGCVSSLVKNAGADRSLRRRRHGEPARDTCESGSLAR